MSWRFTRFHAVFYTVTIVDVPFICYQKAVVYLIDYLVRSILLVLGPLANSVLIASSFCLFEQEGRWHEVESQAYRIARQRHSEGAQVPRVHPHEGGCLQSHSTLEVTLVFFVLLFEMLAVLIMRPLFFLNVSGWLLAMNAFELSLVVVMTSLVRRSRLAKLVKTAFELLLLLAIVASEARPEINSLFFLLFHNKPYCQSPRRIYPSYHLTEQYYFRFSYSKGAIRINENSS